MFISFEGGEGAGKTTLIEGVYQAYVRKGKKVITTRAPGGTHTGNLIREVLLHKEEALLSPRCELFLFLADRSQHVDEVIFPALQAGTIVLCDRFNDSTVAYQGGARGVDQAWIRTLCAFATRDVQPDRTFYLDLDPAEGLNRIRQRKGDKIEAEALSFHQKIREAYLEIAQEEPNRFYVLDASQSPAAVLQEALEILEL